MDFPAARLIDESTATADLSPKRHYRGSRSRCQNKEAQISQLRKSHPTKLAANDQQLLYLNAGLAAKQDGDKETAVKFFRLGLTKPADPKLTAELNAALKKL